MTRYVRFRRYGAFSLIETIIVLTILAILLGLSVPRFDRSLEQSRLDIAGANLRSVWSAQRLFWLENRRYATSFAELGTLLDPAITSAGTSYSYALSSPDSNDFTATATRTGSSKWSGQLTVDQTGTVSGSIHAIGETNLVPGFQ